MVHDLAGSPLTGAVFEDLLAAPPGETIEITATADCVSIELRTMNRPWWGLASVVALQTSPMLFLLPIAAFLDLAKLGWPSAIAIVVLSGLAGLAIFSLAWGVLLAGIVRTSLKMSASSLFVKERGSTMQIPRADIRRVALLDHPSDEAAVRAVEGWSYAPSRAAGIAIETEEGRIEALKMWHHSVTEWAGSLIATWADVPLDGDDGIYREAPRHGLNGGMPQKVDRLTMTQLGVACLATFILFSLICLPTVYKSSAAKDWISTDGQVVSMNEYKPKEGKPRVVIHYAYAVHGEKLENHRYSFWDASPTRERTEQLGLEPAKCVVVWYDPESPSDSVLDNSFASNALGIWLFFAAIGVGGVWSLVYARTAESPEIAKAYDPNSEWSRKP